VINEFAELFAATRPDFAPIYREIAVLPEIAADAVLPGERDRSWRTGKKEGPCKHGPSLGRKRLEDVR